jgi:hypothetical protein
MLSRLRALVPAELFFCLGLLYRDRIVLPSGIVYRGASVAAA